MEANFSENDVVLFNKHLKKRRTKVYFEYGTGNSTYQASISDNVKTIYCVESDIRWHNLTKERINHPNIKHIYVDIDSRPFTWGHPGENATVDQKKNYSNQMRNLTEVEQRSINFVLIDGRFRVACCLKCHNIIKDNCLIAFDDFFNRPYYHKVLDYFDVVEQSNDNKMAILKKKRNTIVPKEVIEEYELQED